MANKYTFEDYKSMISIIKVALDLGYKYDNTKGKTKPSFVLLDKDNRVVDRIMIINPNNNSNQGYFRHDYTKGDLISFIKEHLEQFPECAGARNEIDAINKVLASYAGVSNDVDFTTQEFLVKNQIKNAKNFDSERYQLSKGTIQQYMRYFSERNIDQTIVELISPHICLLHDTESKYNYRNLAFPFQIAGEDANVGFEIRGYGGFKRKAEGGNSHSALWLCDFSGGKPEQVRNVYFAECGFDIIAFLQVNYHKLNLEQSVFASTGGSFSDQQLIGTMEYYKNATPVLGFDNDLNGTMYDIRAACLLAGKEMKASLTVDHANFKVDGKEFSIPLKELSYNSFRIKAGIDSNRMKLWKAPLRVKDWNEVLTKPAEAGISKKDHLEDLKDNEVERSGGRGR